MRRIIAAVFRRIKWKLLTCLFYLLRVFPIRNNKIVISNYFGRGYGDNAKYIVEELLRDRKKFDIVWLSNDLGTPLPNSVRAVKYGSLAAIFELVTAEFWIDNCRKPAYVRKRKKQVYIQTWHGFALKRIEKDVESALSKGYVESAKNDSKCINYIISDSKFMTEIYKNSFWYDGEIKEFGSPRNDIIINGNDSVTSKIFEFFKLEKNTMTVLYAPTFRADFSIDAYSLDYYKVIDACEKRFNKKCVILVRLHPNVVEKSENLTFDNRIVNASYYPDMQELLSACDVVISDYSSLMFDFALSGKPCFQFATDIDEYKNDRNFYFDINKLPFSLAQDNNELENIILNFNDNKYRLSLDAFFEKAGMIRDGNSSKKCADLICQVCDI